MHCLKQGYYEYNSIGIGAEENFIRKRLAMGMLLK